MSLILEALKKVEREKQAREPGTVVIAAGSWAAPQRRWWPIAAALAGTAVLAVAGTALVLRPARAPRAAAVEAPSAMVASARVRARPPASAPASAHALLPPPAASSGLPAARTPAVPPRAPERRPAVDPAHAQAAAAPPPPEPVPASEAGSKLRLQAVAEQDGEPVAMINHQLVRVGDTVEGAVVVRIGATEVEVEVDGERRTLHFQ